MLENIGLFLSFSACSCGAILLFSGIYTSDPAQEWRMIAGAVSLAAGLLLTSSIVKSKLHWRRIRKELEEETRASRAAAGVQPEHQPKPAAKSRVATAGR